MCVPAGCLAAEAPSMCLPAIASASEMQQSCKPAACADAAKKQKAASLLKPALRHDSPVPPRNMRRWRLWTTACLRQHKRRLFEGKWFTQVRGAAPELSVCCVWKTAHPSICWHSIHCAQVICTAHLQPAAAASLLFCEFSMVLPWMGVPVRCTICDMLHTHSLTPYGKGPAMLALVQGGYPDRMRTHGSSLSQ